MGLTTEIGNIGENIAQKYLRANGYLICARNWRHGRYELDIVAQKWDMLHFVEVKTRKVGSWTTAEDAITKSKKNSLRRAATAYLAQNRVRSEFQFDLIAVELAEDGSSEIRLVEKILY